MSDPYPCGTDTYAYSLYIGEASVVSSEEGIQREKGRLRNDIALREFRG
ncbi:MAG: hypothetical protein ACFFEX_12175 [Candidatus Thorarchaeota archaeon]